LNTPPGTKIYLKGSIKIKCNLLILDSKNTDVLGGEVDYMVTKWKANKVRLGLILIYIKRQKILIIEIKIIFIEDLTNHIRIFCQTDNPPPPWVPFGIKQKNLGTFRFS
jgi:hypothetical protein